MSENNLSVWSFYCFTAIDSPAMLMPKLLLIAKKKLIKGTIILSQEGFNGSISADMASARLLFDELVCLTNASGVNLKIQEAFFDAFSKFKIKIKKEIVKLGIADLDVPKLRGKYIKPAEWDDFIADENVMMIDTRNNYEFAKGSFLNALNPETENFRDLPLWLEKNISQLKNKKVAMFCTGGIRCEKSTAYLKLLGHDEVYHLEGGILQYFQDTQNKNSKWYGQCFIFDDRSAVDVDLQDQRLEKA